jgi:hypothetical protein
MRRVALLGLVLLLSVPAIAETTKQVPGSGAFSSGTSQSKLPIDAMLHHQPRRSDVQQRELQRYRSQSVEEERQHRQSELDQLYEDVMRRSAPPTGK